MNTTTIQTAVMLGIRILEHVDFVKFKEPKKSWELTCSLTPDPFDDGHPVAFHFNSWAEVDAFITGYSVVVRSAIKAIQTPS
jgi:hypothetical protein